MKFSELSKGTYVSVKFTEDTLDKIQEVQAKLGLLNPVSRDDLHSTIVYSRVFVPFMPYNKGEFISNINHLEIWPTGKGPALILCMESTHLNERHNYGTIIGATFDFPTYTPHVTLSYNLGAQKIDLSNPRVDIELHSTHEEIEDLNLDWAADKV